MKYSIFVLIICTVCSCDREFDLEQLSGYWEIDKVILEDGNTRSYSVNTTIDYIEIESDSTGFRKKLYPRLDGSYQMSADFEAFKIITEGSKVYIEYTTPLMKWKEEIKNLSEEQLEVENENSIRYIYKHFTPISME